jgi:MoaF N-terminal domain
MKYSSLLMVFATLGMASLAIQERQTQPASKKTVVQEAQRMNSLAGKTIRWKFVDGPMAGTNFEHLFHDDGSVTWRMADGEHKGATRTEKSYGWVKVNDRTWAISYLAASGHTLTVVLNLDDGRLVGFASNDKTWYSQSGTFEIVN